MSAHLIKLLVATITFCMFGCQMREVKDEYTNNCRSFPEVMVGVWEAQVNDNPDQKWIFKFETDGTIKRFSHLVAGNLVVDEGGKSGQGPDAGTSYLFILGPSITKYDKEKNQLYVECNIDYYEMKLPQGQLSGTIKDTFVGELSADKDHWFAEWRSYGWLDDAQLPDLDYIDRNPERLVFQKIAVPTQ